MSGIVPASVPMRTTWVFAPVRSPLIVSTSPCGCAATLRYTDGCRHSCSPRSRSTTLVRARWTPLFLSSPRKKTTAVQRAACIAVIVALVTRAVLSCFSFFCELLNVLSLQQQQRVHSHSTSTPWRQRGLRSVCVVFGSDSVRVLRCERFLFGALRSRVAKVLRAVPFAAVAAWSRARTVFTQM